MSVVTPSISFMNDDLSDLDAAGLLAAASGAVRARRLAEVRELEVLAAWAAVHSGAPTDRWDRLVQVGGEGTPPVLELCLGEIALARGTGVMATQHAIADTLDLIHRLPATWQRCVSGEVDVFVARRVAKLSRHLPVDRVGVVDRAVARVIGRESAGRVLAVAEAKIIEADPVLHEERVEAERRRALCVLGPDRRVRAAHRDRRGRGRRRGLGRGHGRQGRGDHRAQVPRRRSGRGPLGRVRVAGPPRRAPGPAARAPRPTGRTRPGRGRHAQ